MKKNNKNKRNKPKISIPRNLDMVVYSEVDRYCITLITGINNGDQLWDVYTTFVADAQYTDLQGRYGLFKYDQISMELHSTNPNSVITTDQQLGSLAIVEGVFNTATTKVVANVVGIPGSKWINNVEDYNIKYKVRTNSWFPSNMANTATSEVPKIDVYYGVYQASTTGAITSAIIFKLYLSCKDKIS